MYFLGCFHTKIRHFCAVGFSALVRIIARLFKKPVKTPENGLYSRNTFEINHVYTGLFSSDQYIKSEIVRIYVTKIWRKLIYCSKIRPVLCAFWLIPFHIIHCFPSFYINVTNKKKDFALFLPNINSVKTLWNVLTSKAPGQARANKCFSRPPVALSSLRIKAAAVDAMCKPWKQHMPGLYSSTFCPLCIVTNTASGLARFADYLLHVAITNYSARQHWLIVGACFLLNGIITDWYLVILFSCCIDGRTANRILSWNNYNWRL